MIEVVDLFAGAGGLSQGLLQVNVEKPSFKIIAAVEVDEAANRSLRVHLEGQDIPVDKVLIPQNLESETVKQKVIAQGQGARLIVGGPPCQTFSLVGPARVGSKELRQKLKNDPRNRLYKHFMDIVKGIKPDFVVFENVEGIISKEDKDELSGRSKKVIEFVTGTLKDLGYDPSVQVGTKKQQYLKLNAMDYGVPQSRKRVVIIANRLGICNPIPKPTHGPSTRKRYNTVASSIGSLPIVLPRINMVKFADLKKLDIIAQYPSEYLRYFVQSIEDLAERSKGKEPEEPLKKLLSKIKKGYRDDVEATRGDGISGLKKFAEVYNENIGGLDGRMYNQEQFPAHHIARSHNIRDVCIFSRLKQGVSSAQFMRANTEEYDQYLARVYPYERKNHQDTYRKQDWEKPSTTILSHMTKDGLRFIHPEQPRAFTPCEAALIQSFSMSSKFEGTQGQVFCQIGNAVPPLMARAIGEAIYFALERYYANLDDKLEKTN